MVKVRTEREADVVIQGSVPWHDHMEAGPEGVREERAIIIIITEIMGTSWGVCCFCPGFPWLGSQGTCGDYLATRSNWGAWQIMPKSLLLARIS